MFYPELSLWLIVVNTEWYSWHQITDPCYQGNNSESLRSPFCGFVWETCHFFFFCLCFEDALAVCVHSCYFLHPRSCVLNNKHIVTRGVNYSPPMNAPSLKNWISILQKNLLKVYILITTTMLRINCANRIVRATRQKITLIHLPQVSKWCEPWVSQQGSIAEVPGLHMHKDEPQKRMSCLVN